MKGDIRLPAKSEISDIADELGLNLATRELLEQAISSSYTAIKQYREVRARYETLGGRTAIVKYFKDLAALLHKLSSQLSATNPYVDQWLKALYPQTLATLLDHRVFARHGKADLTIGLELMTDGVRVRADRGEGFDIAEAELTERKGRAAKNLAPLLLRGVVAELVQPVNAFLAIERLNRGGRPANAERDYVIDRMAEVFADLTGERPTSSPAGPFVTLCDRVLEVLAIKTDGIETAVQRRLRARRTRQTTGFVTTSSNSKGSSD